MTPQGRGVGPAQDPGYVLDRLAGLRQVIPEPLLEQALLATGVSPHAAARHPQTMKMGRPVAMLTPDAPQDKAVMFLVP